MLAAFNQFVPDIGDASTLAPTAAVVGRTVAGAGLTVRSLATLRGDGEWVRVGRNAFFGERATVHIAHEALAATIGDDVTVGRFGLVHACTLADGVVVADAATVMDGATIGPNALIAPGALVSPRKQLAGGFVYAGQPAAPVREITRAELAEMARAIRSASANDALEPQDLPPLDMAPFLSDEAVRRSQGASPQVGRAFVAPNAVIVGDVRIGTDAGIYYGCVLAAGGARIVVGDRSNVQDNSLIVTDAARGDVVIGCDVTIGHNVRMGAGTFGDRALIGMASVVGDGVVVEPGGCIAAGSHVKPGTRVRSGWIWAGRPARAFREVNERERAMFASAAEIYIAYGAAYRDTAQPATR